MPAVSPSTTLYTLGRGVLSIEEWVGATPPTAPYTDVGNCPSFTVTVTEETLEHFNYRSGIRTKDKEVTLETGYTIEFTLDEVSAFNLKTFLRASQVGNSLYAMQAADAEFALKFVSDNPVGPNETWYFWKGKIKPNGAFNLISDEWSVMTFTAEGLSDAANHASSPYFTVTFATTTTTTT